MIRIPVAEILQRTVRRSDAVGNIWMRHWDIGRIPGEIRCPKFMAVRWSCRREPFFRPIARYGADGDNYTYSRGYWLNGRSGGGSLTSGRFDGCRYV